MRIGWRSRVHKLKHTDNSLQLQQIPLSTATVCAVAGLPNRNGLVMQACTLYGCLGNSGTADTEGPLGDRRSGLTATRLWRLQIAFELTQSHLNPVVTFLFTWVLNCSRQSTLGLQGSGGKGTLRVLLSTWGVRWFSYSVHALELVICKLMRLHHIH